MKTNFTIYAPHSPRAIKQVATNIQKAKHKAQNLVKVNNLYSKDINGNYYISGSMYIDQNLSANLLKLVNK